MRAIAVSDMAGKGEALDEKRVVLIRTVTAQVSRPAAA